LGSDDDSANVADVVGDSTAAAPFDHLVRQSDNELLREVLATLTPRESRILSLRFGLDDDTPRTLEEVGQQFGVTRERIRQIQDEALRKLRVKIEQRDRPAPEPAFSLAE
jgi:RNA polymerase primary sigma factor